MAKSSTGFKNKATKFIIAPIVIVLAFTVYWFVYYNITEGANEKNYQFVLDHMNSSGKLVDLKNEIGVQSIDNVKLYVTDKHVKIVFGYLTFKWTPEEFATAETQEKLNRIGFESKVYGEPKKLHVFYLGEEVKRWVE